MKKIAAFLLLMALCVCVLCSCGGAGTEKIAGTYSVKENVYYSSLVNAAFNPTDKYTVEEADGEAKLLHECLGISGEEISAEIGELKKFSLKKSNFDELFFHGVWESGLSAESIRKSNDDAWKAEANKSETVYVLLQDDGTVVVVGMKTKDGYTSCAYIREISPVSE